MQQLFVFIQMGGTVDNIQLAFIPPDETSDPNSKNFQTPLEYFEDRFENFDVTNAQCFDPLQKDRLLAERERARLEEENAALHAEQPTILNFGSCT